ncbi:MAG: amidophosphoribosyltransferase [Cryomorphaceae bacterium MED-G14]|nr:MAG: amidophosphoribosyltransferase [Cryomorphaceae bacterium MED-G14]|tara:strand:- start:1801 stop:3699 length:1899 start_codon:yes stop_codon:yes gene_type:complete
MSDHINHECGLALIRLLKPLEFYEKKYGTNSYGLNKLYLMLEKQHNRGQDGAGFASVKLDTEPGQRFLHRERSANQNPIQEIFDTSNKRIAEEINNNPSFKDNLELQKKEIPHISEVFLGHVRYGTFGKNSKDAVHPFLRQNNWMHRNLIVAGNFNMTNNKELFENLVLLGQHPKEMSDTVTVMEKIGHFLDNEVAKIYRDLKKENVSKMDASPLIEESLDIPRILRKASQDWDGGFTIGGMLGHGDAFVIRDPAGIRPAFYYVSEEVVVVASERPVIQTVFNTSFDEIKEVNPGDCIVIKKNGKIQIKNVIKPVEKKACSFERIYFSRGSDKEIYSERKKLGSLLFPQILKAINNDLQNTVFSYIPNTAEVSFYGMVHEAQDFMNKHAEKKILSEGDKISKEKLRELLALRPRIEKVAIKDAKLRTFITDDSNRDELVRHVYDITYGSIKKSDNLVIIDDSIVRGTTLQKSIIKMLDRLCPKKIIIVSSAPQIRYPDCYGIDMAKMTDLIAFRAAIELVKENDKEDLIHKVYEQCLLENKKPVNKIKNLVKKIYSSYSDDQISNKISSMLKDDDINAEVDVVFQSIDNLHKACPNNLGDWYFSGVYPSPGGNKVVNKAFINYYEGSSSRAY